jgi:hypothetical protein
LSHKGLISIIIVVSVVSVGIYASSVLPTQSTSPFSILINSIQQDIVLETIHATDEVKLKKDINLKIAGTPDGERGRVEQNNAKSIVIESTFDVTDSMQATGNKTEGSHHSIVINDSVSSTTPDP